MRMRLLRDLSRRVFFRAGLLLPGAGAALAAPPARPPADIYRKLGVRTFINAVGTLTTFSGTLMPLEVKQAMEEASRNFVNVHELQGAVGRRLAELTDAETAIVTADTSASLCLTTCTVT